jgi:tricorn protease
LNLFEGKEAYFAPTGTVLAFVRGPGAWYRRGYRGSANDDIWIAGADGRSPVRLTTFDGQDTSPMWAADGRTLYYVTELPGPVKSANIVAQPLTPGVPPAAAGPPKPLTDHTDDSVRRARISGDGAWIVYECGADLWVVGTQGGSPRKLAIEVHADDKSNTERAVTFTRDATDYALSPDEQHAVVVVHGELFLTRVAPTPGKATRLTESPAFDHAPAWSPDGKKVLFASDRSGVIDLYLVEPDDPEHPEFTKAHKFKVRRITDTREEETAASFSPKGDRIAFLRTGRLWTANPDGSGAKPLVDLPQVFDYDWSPDGAWLAFARADGSFASEIYLVPADGREPPRNVTRYATFNGDVSWSQTGGKLAFVSQRRGTFAMHVLSLQKPAVGAATPPVAGGPATGEIDWDGIHLRVTRPTPVPAEAGAISPDGSLVAFRSLSNGDDLWVVGSGGGSLARVTTGNQSPRAIRWSKKSPGLVHFLDTRGELRAARVGLGGFALPAGTAVEPLRIGFSARMSIRRDEEFTELFAQAWRVLADSFYDPAYHGTDWPAVRHKYASLLPHVATTEDLYALVHLMLGELNASHVGIGGKLPTPDEPTAELGLIFDESYPGPGLKVAEVLAQGPADRRGLALKAGDVILAVDRTELTERTNLSRLLNGKVGEVVVLDVSSVPSNARARRRVELIAASREAVTKLTYARWVAKNTELVAKLSNGTVGYVHIPDMEEDGLEAFVRALYSENFDKEALILDVRYNGGGFTHDQVLNYLAGREHTVFRQRHGGEGLVFRNYDRKWTRPAAVLVNNRTFSDAEVFPHAFRSMGLGKVVGQPTGGQVIGATRVRLIDGSWLQVPRTGIYTVRGDNLERGGVRPDVVVEPGPDDWAKGLDRQLQRTVELLRAEVAARKGKKGPVAGESGSNPPGPGG